MTALDPISLGRYRRRILGLGGLALVVTFAIGAAIFIPVVQNDLEERVEAQLDDAGIDGVTASFSGQDGTLTCVSTLDDPGTAVALAEDVHGVRVIDLDRTCSGNGSVPVEESPVTEVPDTGPAVTDPTATEPTATEPVETPATTEVPPVTEPGADGIVDIVNGDPLFTQLAALLTSAGLDGDDALGGDGPFTLLAPTDAAFDSAFEGLGADAFEALESDPDALRTVLLHHVADGAIASSDFVAGDLEMLDGTPVTVDPDAAGGITFASDGAVSGVDDAATQLDIEASNGVVHAIDRLLIPEDLGLRDAAAEAATTTAAFAGGQITLSGVVQTQNQRTALVAASQAQLNPANVIDELAVASDAPVDDADIDRLVALVAAMPSTLIDGDASLIDAAVTLTGTYLDDAAQTSLAEIGSVQDAMLNLTAREVADADSAAALQSELNDFVRDDPVLFEPNSATLTAESAVVIEQLRFRAARLAGTAVTVVGHTDSDGNPATNQALSELRAASVLEALVERGLDATILTSNGRGASEPVTDASGAEDKAASRRVEFVVEAV